MKYKVLVGLNYPVKGVEKRAEPGDVVDDIPERSLHWLLRQGCVEEVPSVTVSAGVAEAEAEAFGGDD